MNIVYSSEITAGSGTPASGTGAISVGAAVSVGTFLVLLWGTGTTSGTAGTITSISDSQGNTWTIDVTSANGSGAYLAICSSYITTALTTSDTINLGSSAAGWSGEWMQEAFTGIIANSKDVSASNTGTSVTTLTSGTTAATSSPNELVVGGYVFAAGAGAFTPGTGFSSFTTNNPSGLGIVGEYMVAGQQGTQTAPGTVASDSGTWAGAVVTYTSPLFGPNNTPLLDTFYRANASTLGSNWQNGNSPSFLSLQILSNAAIGNGGTAGQSWNDNGWLAQPNNDQEAWVQFLAPPTAVGSGVYITVRTATQAMNAVTNCYAVNITSTQVILGWFDSYNDWTALATYTHAVVAGEYIAISAISSVITAWSCVSSAWTALGAGVTDTNYTSGYIGLHTVGAEGFQFANFGGGSIGSLPPVPKMSFVAMRGNH